MAAYTIINATEAQLTAVNAGSVNVDAMSYKDGVVLTNTELATLLDGVSFGKAVAVIHDLTGLAWASQLKRAAATAGLFVST